MPDLMEPKISVITVTFNAEKTVEKTVRSVVGQTYPALEYIVVDGASKDGTMALLEGFRDRISVLVSEPDKGIYDAMNKGIGLATGEWIIFMNAGDCFIDDDVLKDVAAFIVSHPEADAVYGGYEQVFEYGTYPVMPRNVNLERKMSVSHQAIFVKTELLRQHPFNTAFRFAADFEQLSSIYLDGSKFVGMDRLIARVEKREGTTFENEIASAEEMYSLLSSRGIDIAAERKKMLRHKKLVRLFKQCIPGFLSAPVLRLIAKYYKAL